MTSSDKVILNYHMSNELANQNMQNGEDLATASL